jgi:hypothetical protein
LSEAPAARLEGSELKEQQRGILRGDGVRDRRRVPVPGQQLVEPAGGVIGNAVQHVGEPGVRVDVVELAVAISVYIALPGAKATGGG